MRSTLKPCPNNKQADWVEHRETQHFNARE